MDKNERERLLKRGLEDTNKRYGGMLKRLAASDKHHLCFNCGTYWDGAGYIHICECNLVTAATNIWHNGAQHGQR